MSRHYIIGLLMLLSIAAIWGMGFVFQREGMDHIGPFTFNTIRFAIGALSVVPVIWVFSRTQPNETEKGALLKGGVLAGLCLFCGINLQQFGMVETSAGKAAFITGLYMILVPLIGLFMGQVIGTKVWFAGGLAVAGMYLLSVTEGMQLAPGDGFVFLGSFFWAAQVMIVGHYSQKVNGPKFAFLQFVTVAVLSFPFAIALEGIDPSGVADAWVGLFFTGVVATGVAITFQILAQARVPSVQAALVMSLETVFGALGGWWILNELFTDRMLVGALLLMTAILLAQLPGRRAQKPVRWPFRRWRGKRPKT